MNISFPDQILHLMISLNQIIDYITTLRLRSCFNVFSYYNYRRSVQCSVILIPNNEASYNPWADTVMATIHKSIFAIPFPWNFSAILIKIRRGVIHHSLSGLTQSISHYQREDDWTVLDSAGLCLAWSALSQTTQTPNTQLTLVLRQLKNPSLLIVTMFLR